jgi:hypothetical protein
VYNRRVPVKIAGVGVFAGAPFLCVYQVGSAVSCMEVPSLINTNVIITGEKGLRLRLNRGI